MAEGFSNVRPIEGAAKMRRLNVTWTYALKNTARLTSPGCVRTSFAKSGVTGPLRIAYASLRPQQVPVSDRLAAASPGRQKSLSETPSYHYICSMKPCCSGRCAFLRSVSGVVRCSFWLEGSTNVAAEVSRTLSPRKIETHSKLRRPTP